jgi:iron complex outermembrane receptor protein
MKLLFSILCIGFSLFIYSQNTLTGKVTDSNDAPLPGVDIYIPNLHKGTSTDIDGNYIIKNLPNNSITIVFAFIGYKSISKTIELNKNETNLDIVLKESVFQMDEIIVSTPFNKLQSENVMKVEHKTIQQLQQQGATTLIEGLSNITGVSQVSTGVSIGKPVIRGLSGNRVLVYAQGVRLENQQFGDEHGLGLNDAGVESVEVIKGPASLLYGSDALGGVLYFNPERFAHSNSVSSNISQKYFTNTQGSNTTFNFKASAEKFKFLTSMAYTSHIDYKTSTDNRVTNTRFNETDLKTGLQYSNEQFSSTLRYNYNLLNLGINEGEIEEQSTHRDPDFPKQRVHNHILSLHNHIFLKNSSLDIDLGYLFNDRSEFEDSNQASLRMLLNTINYDIKYHLPEFNNIESIIGVQGMHQTNTNKAEELLIPDATTNDVGFFGTANYDWKKNSIQAGLRFDHRSIDTKSHGTFGDIDFIDALDKSFNSFTASAGYKTDLAKKTTLRINVATGFRAPNLAELTSNGVHEGTNRYEIGNPNLKNEQNYQLDIALEYNNEHIEFFANGFYNSINDYIFISPTNEVIDNTDIFKYLQDNANLYGGEFGFHLHPHPLDWLHFESSFETVIGKQKNGEYLPLIPANKLKNVLRTEFTVKDWLKTGYASLKLESVFNQKKINTFETDTKGYNLLHFSLGGNIKFNKIKFELNLNVNNIFDTGYISHLSRLKRDGIQNIGRTMMLGVNFDI